MTLYVKYSRKHPHLPIAVADSAQELAAITGMTKDSIWTAISKKRGNVAKVEIEEETE